MKFNASKSDSDLIYQIVLRAEKMQDINRQDMMMDLEGCHCNGCPLKLAELLVAKPFDFTHDVGGINRHINRETGKLEGGFLPRYAL